MSHITPEQVLAIIRKFEDEKSAYMRWGLIESSFASSLSATRALCEHIADRLNAVQRSAVDIKLYEGE